MLWVLKVFKRSSHLLKKPNLTQVLITLLNTRRFAGLSCPTPPEACLQSPSLPLGCIRKLLWEQKSQSWCLPDAHHAQEHIWHQHWANTLLPGSILKQLKQSASEYIQKEADDISASTAFHPNSIVLLIPQHNDLNFPSCGPVFLLFHTKQTRVALQ